MFPIYEQKDGNGIGHHAESFITHFKRICAESAANNGTKAFAFILYNFEDHNLKTILKDHGVFTKLDRLSGKDLSLFYLHSGIRRTVINFNTELLSKLGVEEECRLPCVLFFKLEKEKIVNIEIAQLNCDDLIHSFQELYSVIEKYIARACNSDDDSSDGGSNFIQIFKSYAKTVSVEAVTEALQILLNTVFQIK